MSAAQDFGTASLDDGLRELGLMYFRAGNLPAAVRAVVSGVDEQTAAAALRVVGIELEARGDA